MLYLVLFVAFVISLLWVFQIVLLDDFYHYYKQRQLTAAADAIARNIDNAELSELAEHLAGRYEVCVLVIGEDGTPVVSAEGAPYCLLHRMMPRDLSRTIAALPEDGTARLDRFSVRPFRSDRFNPDKFQGRMPDRRLADESQTLLYGRRLTLADGRSASLLLNAAVTPVDATVDTLRSQLAVVTAIVLLAAVALAFLMSRRISRPIIETNDAARALARAAYAPGPHSGSYREIDELNTTLTAAAHELGKVEGLQHELIANISHDLRTPLTMIGGYAEVMRDIPSENTPENMQIIIDETARLSTLVNELLDFSRMQTGEIPMTPVTFCLTEAVNGIIGRVGKLTEKDGYVIRFAPDAPAYVLADETRVGQVIYNLLGNALTYTGEDRTVNVTQEVRGDRVRLTVRDTGKGIAPDELPLIWNRYYRTRETHRRAVVGSGLGLNIVRTILEQHAAPYGVESGEDTGTAFWLELPRRDAP